MPIRFLLKKTGIRSRIFIAAIMPVILMSVLLGNYYIINWKDDAYKRINENGARYSVDLSKLSEFALFTNNIDFLDILSISLFSDPDVYSVRIMDKEKNTIIYRVSPHYSDQHENNPESGINNDLVFMAMVHPGQLTTIEGDEFYDTKGENQTGPTDLLGWIEVTMTDAHEMSLKDKIVVKMLLIMLTVLVATFTLAFSISSRITRPILGMKENVAKLASGDILPSHKPKYPDELGDLENAFHEMAVAVHNSKFELQKRVDIATARNQETIAHLEKTNAELVKARELLFQANAAKSEFMAKMSHEIRTPLHSIIGYINLIKKTDNAAKQNEYLRVIEGASDHLLLLINDILDLSSIDSGGVELAHEDFNLRECVEDVVLLLAPRSYDKDIDFIFLFDSDVPVYVVGDQYSLKQILLNLLGNAIKFTETGEVVLHVSLDSNDIDSSSISMQITDTGIGIDADHVDLIQTPFYQVDNSRKRGYEGTGLGLAIVKKLLDIMGSRLIIDSEPAKGSTFCFSVTLERQRGKPDLARDYTNCFRDVKLLCFESHPLILRGLRNQVLGWTTQVYTATTIEKVGDLLETAEQTGEPFDLIILGINRCLVNLSELSRKLRHHVENRPLAVLFMISDTTRNACDNFTWISNCACISKPAGQDFLRETITSLLGGMAPEQRIAMAAGGNNSFPETTSDNIQGRAHVLLAEDNNFNRVYVATLLRENNFLVKEATNGLEALNLASKESFDLIFMDIHLPEIDGITVARRIKADSLLNRNTPILALTADAYIRNIPEYRQAGFADLVVKPIDETGFWHLLNSYLKLPDSTSSSVDPFDNLDNIKQALLPQLIKELPDHALHIQSAFDARLQEKLADHLHELKGVAGYFKLAALRHSVAIAETYVRDKQSCDWDELTPLIQKLQENIRLILDRSIS